MQIEPKSKKDLPWIEKYRPATLTQLVSHKSIIDTLQKFISEGRLPNLLFYGPPGTGKTSTIVALARQIYRENYKSMILELNASDDRGINVVRETIKDFAGTTSAFTREKETLKLVILDEVDSMTNAAQFALRRTVEKFWKTTRFCLICNYVSKVIPALQSRCTRFKFSQIPLEETLPRVREICAEESLALTEEAIRTVYSLCEGDMRRVVNMLQSLALAGASKRHKVECVDHHEVYRFTNSLSPENTRELFDLLRSSLPLSEIYKGCVSRLLQAGISVRAVLKDLLSLVLQTNSKPLLVGVLPKLADLEYHLSINCEESLQLGYLVAIFKQSKSTMVLQ